jgi:AcrR family transcriptional regulator
VARKLHPTPQHEERFHEILEASLHLFARHGYEKTSIDRIAKAIKATKGLVYYYFRSKEDILEAMVTAYDFTPAIATIGKIDPQVPVEEALALIIRGSISLLDSRVEYVRFLYTEGQFIHRQSERLMREILDRWTGAVTVFLEGRVASGELVSHDCSLASFHVTDAVLAYFLKTRVVDPPSRTRIRGSDYFAHWLGCFLHGLSPARLPPPPAARGATAVSILRQSEGVTPEVVISLAPAMFRAECAGTLQAVVHVCVTGPEQTVHTITIANGNVTITSGTCGTADLRITLRGADLVALACQHTDVPTLFLSGTLQVEGSIDLAMRVGRCFSIAQAAAS